MKSIITPVFAIVLMGLIGFAILRNLGPQVSEANENRNAVSRVVELDAGASLDEMVGDSEAPVLLDFYADWCGPCQIQARVLKDLELGPKQAKVIKIDIDKHPELATQFDVRSIPTLVLFEDGKKTYQQTGVHNEEDLRSLLKLN